MKIGFISYSYPLKWPDETTIAHNKIFYYTLKALKQNTAHELFILDYCISGTTTVKARPYAKVCSSSEGLDTIIMFCGPFMPITKNGRIHKNLELLHGFKGKVVFITCDYLLGFDLRASRYGELTKTWEPHALTKGKSWTYVIHAPFEHHFRTPLQRERILQSVPQDRILSVPLNMAGISDEVFQPMEIPPFELLYCGAFRNARIELFQRYFCSPQAKDWIISSTQKEEFAKLKVFPQLLDAMPGALIKMLNKSMAQIVISDTVGTRRIDTSTPLPFRFWEAASAKSCVFFDSDCSSWLSNPFNKVDKQLLELSMVQGAYPLQQAIRDLFSCKQAREKHLAYQDEMMIGFNPYVDWEMEKWFL
jgi:hypothetical protein